MDGRTLGEGWSRLDGERLATWWRPWKLLQDELTPRITGVQSWQPALWPACLQVLVEDPVGENSNGCLSRLLLAFMGLTPCSNHHSYRTLPHDYLFTWRLCPWRESGRRIPHGRGEHAL